MLKLTLSDSSHRNPTKHPKSANSSPSQHNQLPSNHKTQNSYSTHKVPRKSSQTTTAMRHHRSHCSYEHKDGGGKVQGATAHPVVSHVSNHQKRNFRSGNKNERSTQGHSHPTASNQSRYRDYGEREHQATERKKDIHTNSVGNSVRGRYRQRSSHHRTRNADLVVNERPEHSSS